MHRFRGLALHTWTVDTTPLEGALAAARAGGFDAVELRRVDFERCAKLGLSNEAVLDLVRGVGLPVSAMGVEYGWVFSTGAERERLFGVFREACENAVALNCGLMMSAIGPGEAPSICSTSSLASKYRETVVSGTLTMIGWLSVGFIRKRSPVVVW